MSPVGSDKASFACASKKHRWRVGIMTEMAPVGYVGVSPKCILGFNKVGVFLGVTIDIRLLSFFSFCSFFTYCLVL